MRQTTLKHQQCVHCSIYHDNKMNRFNKLPYVVVTCEIKLFRNYFSLRRRLSEIILFQHVETCLKLFQNYSRGVLQFMNIFQHVHCR